MLNRITLLASLLGLMLVTGCSPYINDIYYTPHPAVAEVQVATTQPAQVATPPVTTYATIVGVRREDRDQHIPLSVEVRLRLENHGSQAVSFDPHTLDLTNGELVVFPPPIVRPPQAFSILPGQPAIVQANFPLPPGFSYDGAGMATLQLHWDVQIDGHVVQQMAKFHRAHRYYYYDPYWDYPPYGYGYPYDGYPFIGVGGTFIIRR